MHFIVLDVSFHVSCRIISVSSFNKEQKTQDNRNNSFQMAQSAEKILQIRFKEICNGEDNFLVLTVLLSFFVISMKSVIIRQISYPSVKGLFISFARQIQT